MANQTTFHRRGTVALTVVAAVVLSLLRFQGVAHAAFEEVGTFGGTTTQSPVSEFAEEVQLGGVGGLAVNVHGTGGVPAGTVYAVAKTQAAGKLVAVYQPAAEGQLKFVEGWDVKQTGQTYQHCGPALPAKCTPRPNSLANMDVAVNQTTGNVYVEGVFEGEEAQVVEYDAKGAAVLARFAAQIPSLTKTMGESPSSVHEPMNTGALAVDNAGTVYLYDEVSTEYARLMVFKPESPNDFEHYKFAGEVLGTPILNPTPSKPTLPQVDEAGNIYVVTQGAKIEEYPPQTASPFPSPHPVPTCSFTFASGGVIATAVNPATGEVFFNSYKSPKLIRRLGPCDASTGKFTEISPTPEGFAYSPERGDLWAMAVDPDRQVSVGRGVGTLYAAAPNAVGEAGNGAPGQSSLGYIFSRPAEISPEVGLESAVHITSTTADLGAQINPKSSATRFAFQYLTQAEYEANDPADRFAGAKEAPPGGAFLGEGNKVLEAAASVVGLSPDTTYHYRVMATSHCSSEDLEKVCSSTGVDQTFNTFPAEVSGLPDGRAYELVSPALKNGGEVFPVNPFVRNSCTECKPVFVRPYPMQSSPSGDAVVYEGNPFSFTEGAVRENEYIARRTSEGWKSTDLSPGLALSGSGEGYEAFTTELDMGLFGQASPSLSPEAPSEYANLYVQPSADPLTLTPLLKVEPPNRPTGGVEGFKMTYDGGSADLTRAVFEANDALPAETAFAPEAIDGGASKNNLYEWAAGELRLVNVAPGNAETQPGASIASRSPDAHAISRDGSRIFWTSEAGGLYVRENAETTVEVPDPGTFLSASSDGAKALLTNGHLYNVDNLAEKPLDLSREKGGFLGILGQSEDLSHIYFVDTAVLTGGEENGHGASAQVGKDNLYAWHEGSTHYLATLNPSDNTDPQPGSAIGAGDWALTPSFRTAEASPNGRWLAFVSRAQLTGYDNAGPCGGSCVEAFLYSSDSGELICASCNPTGQRPLGNSILPLIAGGRVDTVTLPQTRYLTDEGRLVFDSQDSLSTFDTNAGVVPGHAVEDVYEHEPNGVGSCKRDGGCIRLISAGHEPTDSNFLAMDESGANIFFTTRDQLALKDHDDAIDLYDAREGGGISSETESSRGECQGEACQAPVSAPNDPTPGSSTFEGAGNVHEEGKAKKHAKKQKKKRHAKKKHAHKRAAKRNRGGAK